MSNKIRNHMKEEVEALLPLLHETYMRIGRFQKDRSPRNENLLVECLDGIAGELQKFKLIVQVPKQPCFDVLLREDLSISNRIIALDTAVGAMHIEFSVPRMYAHHETEELRLAIEQCRHLDESVPEGEVTGNMICRGLAASPGVACGQVFFWNESVPCEEIPQGCIVVTRMTRPEIVVCMDRVAGIVTDIGGSLCHAAIVARERGVACVVGTGHGTSVLAPGMRVCIDGATGIVTAMP